MTDGFALAGAGPAPKRRGRPPGSTNKRAKDLVGFLDAKCGGSAALQLAKGCMVTVAEVRSAGGSLQKAELAKARRMVEAFEAEQERLNGSLRDRVWAAVQEAADEIATAEADQVRGLVKRMLAGIVAPGAQLTLIGALDRMAEDRRALLPYTDQRQAQKVELKSEGFVPVMILDTGTRRPAVEGPKDQGFQGPLIDVTPVVSRSKSHDGEEA